MGKGLCVEESGVHIAFCAGTGVLVFLDLISHLLLRSYYKHYVKPEDVPESMLQLKDDFVFVFYVSMLSMDSEIGLNMCEALDKVNQAGLARALGCVGKEKVAPIITATFRTPAF